MLRAGRRMHAERKEFPLSRSSPPAPLNTGRGSGQSPRLADTVSGDHRSANESRLLPRRLCERAWQRACPERIRGYVNERIRRHGPPRSERDHS